MTRIRGALLLGVGLGVCLLAFGVYRKLPTLYRSLPLVELPETTGWPFLTIPTPLDVLSDIEVTALRRRLGPLESAVFDSQPERAVASVLTSLPDLPPSGTMKALYRIADDPSDRARRVALYSLTLTPDPHLLPWLRRAFETEEDELQRVMLLRAIAIHADTDTRRWLADRVCATPTRKETLSLASEFTGFFRSHLLGDEGDQAAEAVDQLAHLVGRDREWLETRGSRCSLTRTVEAMVDGADPTRVERLAALVEGSDSGLRLLALQALARAPDRGLPSTRSLQDLLRRTDDMYVMSATITALERREDPLMDGAWKSICAQPQASHGLDLATELLLDSVRNGAGVAPGVLAACATSTRASISVQALEIGLLRRDPDALALAGRLDAGAATTPQNAVTLIGAGWHRARELLADVLAQGALDPALIRRLTWARFVWDSPIALDALADRLEGMGALGEGLYDALARFWIRLPQARRSRRLLQALVSTPYTPEQRAPSERHDAWAARAMLMLFAGQTDAVLGEMATAAPAALEAFASLADWEGSWDALHPVAVRMLGALLPALLGAGSSNELTGLHFLDSAVSKDPELAPALLALPLGEARLLDRAGDAALARSEDAAARAGVLCAAAHLETGALDALTPAQVTRLHARLMARAPRATTLTRIKVARALARGLDTANACRDGRALLASARDAPSNGDLQWAWVEATMQLGSRCPNSLGADDLLALVRLIDRFHGSAPEVAALLRAAPRPVQTAVATRILGAGPPSWRVDAAELLHRAGDAAGTRELQALRDHPHLGLRLLALAASRTK